MIVPREEMEYLIDLMKSGGDNTYDQLEYIDSNSFDIRSGEGVRILEVAFNDKEVIFVKASNKHLKQMVVMVSGCYQ